MPEIHEHSAPITQITIFETRNGKQDELLSILTERAQFMASQPGFVSISLHKSLDGKRVVNYVQWEDRERLTAAHHSPEFRKKWPAVSELTAVAEPNLYDVVHVEQSDQRQARRARK